MKELWKVLNQSPIEDTAGHYLFKVGLLILTFSIGFRVLVWIAEVV